MGLSHPRRKGLSGEPGEAETASRGMLHVRGRWLLVHSRQRGQIIEEVRL